MQIYMATFPHTDERIQEVYRLRYKVYCEERGFERPEDHPGAREQDEFDEVSMHFAAVQQQQVVGTARLIYHSSKGFPIEKHAKIDRDVFGGISRNSVGEISRLAISKEFKTLIEKAETDDECGEAEEIAGGRAITVRGSCRLVTRLYRSIYQECRKKNITHVVAMMANGLYRLLARSGIEFVPIGPPVEYHGLRAPYICCLEQSMQELKDKCPTVFRFITASSTLPLPGGPLDTFGARGPSAAARAPALNVGRQTDHPISIPAR